MLVAGNRDFIKQVSKVQRDSVILLGLISLMIQADHAPMVAILTHHVRCKLKLLLAMFNELSEEELLEEATSSVPAWKQSSLKIKQPPPGCSKNLCITCHGSNSSSTSSSSSSCSSSSRSSRSG
jgi:hypothetical protein